MLKKSHPLRIMMTHTRQRNLWLQAESKSLQRQFKELKVNTEMMKTELEKKGLKEELWKKLLKFLTKKLLVNTKVTMNNRPFCLILSYFTCRYIHGYFKSSDPKFFQVSE